jgi:hypothetical protein
MTVPFGENWVKENQRTDDHDIRKTPIGNNNIPVSI